MALSSVTPMEAATKTILDVDETVSAAKQAAAATVYAVEVDNQLNTNPIYVKLYDSLHGDVTVGTTDPDVVLRCPAGEVSLWPLAGAAGLAFSTGITATCVLEPGTAGDTPPDNAVNIKLFASA